MLDINLDKLPDFDLRYARLCAKLLYISLSLSLMTSRSTHVIICQLPVVDYYLKSFKNEKRKAVGKSFQKCN